MDTLYQTLISVADVNTLLGNDRIVLLDCRYSLGQISKGRRDYLAGHIPGAVFMDIGYDLSSPVIRGVTGRHPLPDPEVLSSALRSAGMCMDSQVIAYDQSNGAFAARGWWLLHWLGHTDVAVLDGGFESWEKMGMPLDNVWPPPKEGNFHPQIQNHLIVDRKEVAAQTRTLMDSREFKRYTGEAEPIDPVAGHIPGAVSIPFTDNTEENGKWKSPEILQEKFRRVVPEDGISPVFYCGSGVTACQNILAYKIATGKDALLYPGSWSEWINYYPAITGDQPS